MRGSRQSTNRCKIRKRLVTTLRRGPRHSASCRFIRHDGAPPHHGTAALSRRIPPPPALRPALTPPSSRSRSPGRWAPRRRPSPRPPPPPDPRRARARRRSPPPIPARDRRPTPPPRPAAETPRPRGVPRAPRHLQRVQPEDRRDRGRERRGLEHTLALERRLVPRVRLLLLLLRNTAGSAEQHARGASAGDGSRAAAIASPPCARRARSPSPARAPRGRTPAPRCSTTRSCARARPRTAPRTTWPRWCRCTTP